MTVSSKWYVLQPVEGQSSQEVRLRPVVRGVENREWASATPSGAMTMSISNAAALDYFVAGEEYEAIFTHRPKPAPGDDHPVAQVAQKSWEGTPDERTYYVCGTCGSYASLNEDGTPNWERHEELFAAKD